MKLLHITTVALTRYDNQNEAYFQHFNRVQEISERFEHEWKIPM